MGLPNDPIMKIDKPHPPWGKHVDIITPLPDIPGIHQIRIGPDGTPLSESVTIKGGYEIDIGR